MVQTDYFRVIINLIKTPMQNYFSSIPSLETNIVVGSVVII